MRKLIIFFLVGIFISCTSRNTVLDDSDANSFQYLKTMLILDETNCRKDSLFGLVFDGGLENLLELEVDSSISINYNAGDVFDVTFKHYQISLDGNRLDLIDSIFRNNNINTNNYFLNKKQLSICRINDSIFNLDAMEMVVVYSESDFYKLKNFSNYVLIESHPMNWVGLMTSNSLFQLINLEDGRVLEFIDKRILEN